MPACENQLLSSLLLAFQPTAYQTTLIQCYDLLSGQHFGRKQ